MLYLQIIGQGGFKMLTAETKKLSVEDETTISPSILLQDSKQLKFFYFEPKDLKKFEVEKEKVFNENVVEYSIPTDLLIEDVVCEHKVVDYDSVNVMIINPLENFNYYIPRNAMLGYEIPVVKSWDLLENSIAYILPTGSHWVEDIPKMSPTMLQSNTPVFNPLKN